MTTRSNAAASEAAIPASLDQFRREMLAAGYDEVLERPWDAGRTIDTHTHPFEANAVVVQGDMWLAVEGQGERHLRVGDRFHLRPGVPHRERYGAQGATYWVARKAA